MTHEWKPRDFRSVVQRVTSARGDLLQAMTMTITRRGFLSCPPPQWDPDGIYRVVIDRGRPQVQRLGVNDTWTATRLSGPAGSEREKHQKFGILDAPGLLACDLTEPTGPQGCTVLYLDVDNFKALNTRFTERVVDRDVLPLLHRAIADAVNEHGFAYAEGGDEMVVLLRNCGEFMGLAFAEALRASVEALPFLINQTAVKLTVSVGLASAPPCDPRELPERANQAKAEAKRQGRNAVCVARPDGVRRVHVRAESALPHKASMWRGAFR